MLQYYRDIAWDPIIVYSAPHWWLEIFEIQCALLGL